MTQTLTAPLLRLRQLRPLRPGALVLLTGAVLSILALALAVVGLGTDSRVITGAPAWLKPAKFAISIAVYCATLAWMLSLVQGHRRVVRLVAWTTAAALTLEMVAIITQVIRGTTSHFNLATAFDALVFEAMGGLVALVFLAAVAAGVLLVRQRGLPRVIAAGIRGGIVVALLGMAEAGLMLANVQGEAAGAHTVGAADGGPGLPLTGWSLEHGDLRVAHFLGLHALQALPLLAWALHRYLPALGDAVQARLVTLATVTYAGAVALLAWQAMRGLPLLRPDLPVAAATAGLLVATGAAAALILRRARR